MSKHKDLPPGAQSWARGIDEALKELDHLRNVVRQLSLNNGIDYSNPRRGLSDSDVPSVHNPVGIKSSALADFDTYNIEDGDVLMWDGTKNKVVPGKPKPAGVQIIPADTWSNLTITNVIIDPYVVNGIGAWEPVTSAFAAPATISYDAAAQNALITFGTGFPEAGRGGQVYIDLPGDVQEFEVRLSSNAVGTGGPINASVALEWFDSSGTTLDYSGSQGSYINPGPAVLSVNGDASGSGLGAAYVRASVIFFNLPDGGSQVRMDNIYASPGPAQTYPKFLAGDYPPRTQWGPDEWAPVEFSSEWDGAANASTSTATLNRRICVPSLLRPGDLAQVLGEGFTPGEYVKLSMGFENSVTTVAGPLGTFDAVLAIGAGTSSNEDTITASGDFEISPEVSGIVLED